jgi:hypothetical protein
LPHGEFASGRIDEVEATSAGKAEDRFGDRAAGFRNGIERGFEVVDADDGQGRGERLFRLAVQADVDVARRSGGIIRTVIGESPAERLPIKPRVSSCAAELGSST